MHEFVHYYANSLFPPAGPTKEYYLVGECVGLDATTAITNPASYVYYVFSKFLRHLIAFISEYICYPYPSLMINSFLQSYSPLSWL